jgi:antitoxin ParD1/3/4
MSTVEKISIALPKAMTKTQQKAVAGGRYASASEVVREALREWQEKQETPKLSLEDLQALWKAGVKSGPGKLGSFDAIKAEAKRRITTSGKAKS